MMRPWPPARAGRLIAAICALGAGRPAAARAEAAVAPEATDGVVIVGRDDDRDRGVVGAAAEAAVGAAGWRLAAEPVAGLDAGRLLTCEVVGEPGPCAPPALAARGIRRLLVVALDHRQADNGAPLTVLTARLIAIAPPALIVGQRFCEHCADDRLTAAMADLARQLTQDLAVRAGRTILDVASTPTGAQITVDGRPVGATDATFNTFPGPHRVVVERAGYRTEVRTIVAEEGKTAAIALRLIAARPAPAPGGSSRLIAGGVVATGLAAVIAGGVLLELGTRGGARDRYIYPGATPAGAALGLAGVAAVAAGVYFGWWRAPASSPAGAPAPGGGVLAGWRAAF